MGMKASYRLYKQKRKKRKESKLIPYQKDQQTVTVMIEIPKGSRNKYEYDKEKKVFAQKSSCLIKNESHLSI